MDAPQVLLRTAAFLLDALLIGLGLVLIGTAFSWAVIVFESSTRYVDLVWFGVVAVLLVGIVLRDGLGGRSVGKKFFGLKIRTGSGKRCGYLRSIVRNVPLVVPGWNLLELYMVFFASDSRRTGDRMAGTRVTEE